MFAELFKDVLGVVAAGITGAFASEEEAIRALDEILRRRRSAQVELDSSVAAEDAAADAALRTPPPPPPR